MPPPTFVFGYVPQTRFNFPFKGGCSRTPGYEINLISAYDNENSLQTAEDPYHSTSSRKSSLACHWGFTVSYIFCFERDSTLLPK